MTGPIPVVIGLRAAPPSNGAHMLAWWLNERGDRWGRFAAALSMRSGWVEDLLSGEFEPGEEMAHSIAGYTEGRVPAGEWQRGCMLDWTDKPLGWVGPPGRFAAAAPGARA